ncbi:GSK3-beta interaction protein-like [Aedes aegypti]|uniref:GSKIP domain-containing protein n=1 Tax=Aedes aegypti TaxID=7159 RepID=A0A6I8TVX5_AEDAE|nr:GSK3-beta interaction protein [Aedes aegypti]XP_021712774.1 GSK3-beta interaction protein-like [Aedes aegypti]
MESAYEKFYSEQDDVLDWTKEAQGVIQDIVRHVKEAQISNQLPTTDSEAYINLRTLEGTEVCIKLNREGLRIVGDRFDCVDHQLLGDECFETPYSLLSHVSPAYVESFGSCLADALSKQIQERMVGNGAQAEDEKVEGAD